MQVIAKIFGKYMVFNHKWSVLKVIKGIASRMLHAQAKIHWGKSWVNVSISSEEGQNFSKMTVFFRFMTVQFEPILFPIVIFRLLSCKTRDLSVF